MLLRITSIFFITLVFFSTLAASQTFQDTHYSSPNGPTDLFVADLNHDGHDDVVTTQRSADMVTVFLNHGNGTFTDGGSATYVTAAQPVYVVATDLNGDGHPDIATAGCSNGTGEPSFVSILFGNGDGTFQNHVDYTIPQCAFSIGFIKVAADTLPSLLIADGTHIQILRNNGKGVFTLQTITYPGSDIFLWASAADYNRDGIRDIAFVEQNRPLNQNRLLILNGKADGTFAPPRVVFSSPASGTGSIYMNMVNTVDVNGDGIADLLVSLNQNNGSNGNQGGVQVFVNTGTGNFTRSVLSLGIEQFASGRIAEGDFTGTGLHDIVTGLETFDSAGQEHDGIVLFPATSKTSWGTPRTFPLGNVLVPRGVMRGNFNADTRLDFAFTTVLPDSVHFFLNTTAACGIPAAAGVAICSPKSGSTVTSPVAITASANGGGHQITAMKAYIDGKQVASSTSNSLSGSAPEAAGTHQLIVNAWNSAGQLFQAKVTFTVH